MAKKHLAILLPITVVAGTPVDVTDMITCTVDVVGTFDATYQVMVSYDGTNYVAVGSAMTDAGAAVNIADNAVRVRIDCTEYTSGTPTGSVGGIVST